MEDIKISDNFKKDVIETENKPLVWINEEVLKIKHENQQLKSVLNEVREYILEKCPHSAIFRNEHIDKIYEILKKVGGSNE